jgi:glycerate-2-kinase
VRGAIEGASAMRAVRRAVAEPRFAAYFAAPSHVIAVGKAAGAMAAAIADDPRLHIKTLYAAGTHPEAKMSPRIEWHEAAHPLPDLRSVAAAERALQIASQVPPGECLVLLLSGGASALMAAPAEGLSLADKQHVARTMMLSGADIQALNTVRKHLSRVKGGRLAAACAGATLTLAVSDVIGDDLSVIGSGPGLPDASTWAHAAAALRTFGGDAHSDAVQSLVERALQGAVAETPKPGDESMSRAAGWVIASRGDALGGARSAAERLGYHVIVIDDPVCGEARASAPAWFAEAQQRISGMSTPVCVLSAGETTVHVTGGGRGGRNQEFVLSLVERLSHDEREVLIASVGTDGIDGPTDAAGALADRTTFDRAQAIGFSPATFLDDNNAYDFFAVLGDLIHLGRTDTNVGDVQILLA